MESGDEFVNVSTSAGSAGEAAGIAGRVVRERLAACAQYWPISSVYWWKGNLEEASEFLIVMKTRRSLAGKLVDFIRGIHSYELPEVVVSRIDGGLAGYLEWISKETGAE